MNYLLPLVVAALVTCGLYMMMRRSMVKLLIGLSLLSHASHLLIFSAGKLVRGRPPLIPEDAEGLTGPTSDPLPQALILTAIVISFALLSFAIGLVFCAYQQTQTDDLDQLTTTED